ncbi:MAG: class II aldolase/adducin family protein [Anaerolineae bacterium]|nr:class II aldolase/adducin family protein [Anaerolineae bacterium]MDW8101895.1 class II aldolase/adducin family protein [Anaerolineae bacterium]
MKFAVVARDKQPVRDALAEKIVAILQSKGHILSHEDDPEVGLILNLTDANEPRPYRRKSKGVFVASLATVEELPENAHRAAYTVLVRSLSNLVLYAHVRGENTDIYFTTLEAGFYKVPWDPEEVYSHLMPLACSVLVIENEIIPDLPPAYWNGTPVTEKLIHYGREMDRMGILPAPFPIHELLSERDLRHVYLLYGITGLSYGNLSAREDIPELGGTTFWMTARGVNKAKLSRIGKDIVLIKGFNPEKNTILVSVPPDHDPTVRASVDAIEHYLIYSTFPEVRAIVHAHAWMEGVVPTRQNYPCGTRELAQEVVNVLKQAQDPSRAIVGLKNHGLTITGRSLDEIFERIRGKLITQVPMMP